MTITQTEANLEGINFVIKRQRVDFVNERFVFMPLASFLPHATTYPLNWGTQTFTSNLDYAAKHPFTSSNFFLLFDNPSSYKLRSNYLDTPKPTYNFGRVLLSRGIIQDTSNVVIDESIYYSRNLLFQGRDFNLDASNSSIAITSISLLFNTFVTGQFFFHKQLPKIM